MNYFMGVGKVIKDPNTLSNFENGEYVAEPKYDGIFLTVETDKDGNIINSVTRKNLKKEIFFQDKKLIPNSAIVGELTKDKWHVFDIPKYNNKDMTDYPFSERRNVLEGFSFYDNNIVLVPEYKNNFLKAFKQALKDGNEGLVIKKLSSKYAIGTHSVNWHKIKKSITIDYVITDYIISKSILYKNLVTAFKIGLYENGSIKTVGKVNIASPKMKKEISTNPKSYIGRIVEVSGQEVFPSGAMRFPVLVRFRDDLELKDATLGKMMFEDTLNVLLNEMVYDLNKAFIISEELKTFLQPAVVKQEVVGSIARYHKNVSDIDIVVVPKVDIQSFLKENKIKVTSGKEKSINFMYKSIPVNLWTVKKESFGAAVLHFSAGKGIIQLKRLAIEKGYTLNRYGLFNENKERIAGENYEDILKILNTSTKFVKIKMLEKATKNVSNEKIIRFIREGQFPRITNNYLRFRQEDPNIFDEGTFRIKKDENGNATIFGKIKGKWFIQSIMINKSNIKEKEAKKLLQQLYDYRKLNINNAAPGA